MANELKIATCGMLRFCNGAWRDNNGDPVDIVEVVRCRDCKHYSKGMAVGMCKRVPNRPIIPMVYDNYCKFGERSEGK